MDDGASTAGTTSLAEQTDRKNSPPASNTDRANPKPAARTPSHSVNAKQESFSHTAQGEVLRSNVTGMAAAGGNQTLPNQADVSANSSSSSGAPDNKGFSSNGATQQNGLPVAATVALGGSKSLAGAAFAMHITPTANQGSVNANNASQTSANSSSAAANAGVPDGLASVAIPGADPVPSMLGIAAASAGHAQPQLEISGGANLSSVPTVPWASPLPAGSVSQQPPSNEPASATAEASEITADEPAAPQPVRSLQLQLAGEGDGRVDVRLVEHAGGLSVSVRASDSTLTRGLQENLPELSARLAADKYQTHTFLPPAEASSNGSPSSSSDQPSGQPHEQGNRSFSQGGSHSGGDPNSRQSSGQGGKQAGQQQQTAAWWRQLAMLGGASANTSSSVQDSQTDMAANPVTKQ
jgi:hypothetical protein